MLRVNCGHAELCTAEVLLVSLLERKNEQPVGAIIDNYRYGWQIGECAPCPHFLNGLTIWKRVKKGDFHQLTVCQIAEL